MQESRAEHAMASRFVRVSARLSNRRFLTYFRTHVGLYR